MDNKLNAYFRLLDSCGGCAGRLPDEITISK